MDSLPFDFYNKVTLCSAFYDARIRNCGTAPGILGSVALDYIANQATYVTTIKNGQIVRAQLLSVHNKQEDGTRTKLRSTTKKYLQHSEVSIFEDSKAERDSRSVCRLPEITTSIYLLSPTISKASERLIDSIRIVSRLDIYVPIAKHIQEIMKKMVQKRTLAFIFFRNRHQLDEAGTKLLFSLLKQDQFDSAVFYFGCNLSWMDVIAEWKENSHRMIGKKLGFIANLGDHFGPEFQACSEEERLFLRKCYGVDIKENSTTLVLRGETERSIYVHVNDIFHCSTMILFA